MRKLATGIIFILFGLAAAFAQTTQITATNIAKFGGAKVTGQFCVTPTDSFGNAINLTTPTGQQFAPNTSLCFPITAGVLSSAAIVPDTSLTQPVNACYKLTVSDNRGNQIGTYPCIQPSGTSWSFDAYVPSTLPSTTALTLPQFLVNGTLNPVQGTVNFVGGGVSYGAGGVINISSSGAPTIANGTILGNVSGVTAAAAALTASQVSSLIGLGNAPGYTNGIASTAVTRTVTSRLEDDLSVKDFGAVCNGSSNPASGSYANLTALQAKYSFATALTNQMDWLGMQAALNALSTNGGHIHSPAGICISDQPIVIPAQAVDGNSPNGGNGIYIVGDGKGVTFWEPTTDFGSGSALFSCGAPSATPNLTSGAGTGRYANNGCFGAIADMTVLEPNSTVSAFGVAPTISGTPVGMDGIKTGSAMSLYRLQAFGFYNGINAVGDHFDYQDVESTHNYCGLYFAPQNVNLFGDVIMTGHDNFGGNSFGGICVDKDAGLSIKESGELYVGHQPYGVIKFAGVPDAYVGQNTFFSATIMQELQGESIGNALIWDDNYTQSGGGMASPTAGSFIINTTIHGYSSYQSTYKVTAGGRGFYSYITAYNIDGLYFDAEISSFPFVSGMTAGIYATSIGYEAGGITLSADFDTLLPTYGNTSLVNVESFDYSNRYIKFTNPGKWTGGCYSVYGSATVTAGQLLANSSDVSEVVSSATTPVMGVAMQTMTIGSSSYACVPYADQGNAVPVLISGVTSAQQGKMLVAGSGGAAVPLTSSGGYTIGTLIDPVSSSSGLLKLYPGGFIPNSVAGTSNENLSFSATPTFSTSFTSSRIALSGTITSFTLAAGSDGQTKCLEFAHDSTSTAYTVTPPSNVLGFMSPIGTQASKHDQQCFTYFASDSAWVAQTPGVINQ